MNQKHVIKPQALTKETFAPYGQAITVPEVPAPKTGVDWDCWFKLGDLGALRPSVGIVTTRPTKALISTMEREPKPEFLLPISGPVIQTVALPGDLENHEQQPEAATVRAFIVRPGQAIIMASGTWHWAALPLDDEEVLYYFITEPHPPEPGREESPWIPFAGNDVIQIAK